ncbi:MAG: response regulator [Pontiellaceae bacterium]|nr:response regulator [Pontiellaceae bacterium]MBN2784692.1 response regulator [Pontiellaceae bacterium]
MKQAANFFRIVFHDIHDAVFVSTPEGNVIYMNPSAASLTGYCVDETGRVTSRKLLPEAAELTRHKNDGQFLKTKLARVDGSHHYADLHWNEVEFSGMRFVRHILRHRPSCDSIVTRVEEILKSEDTMALLLMNLMEHMTDMIYFKDTQSRFIMVNKAFCERTGANPETVAGRSDEDLFAEAHARKAFEDEQKIIATGNPLISVEEEEIWPDGRTSWVSSTKLPLRNEMGEIIGTFGVSRDISERKAMEAELHDARIKAEEAAVAKSAFLANMSHEIRTPLNAVVGMSDLLAETKLSDEQKECVATISNSSTILLDIINDILDISKIEAGKLQLEAVPFNPVQIIEKAVDIVAPLADDRNLELMHYFHGTLPHMVIGDPVRLQQILLNLLSNAIKFTTKGEILIDVECIPEQDGQSEIRISVQDTGIGMSQEEAERVFRPFEQADSSVTRKYGGTGLGLSICRRLVNMMGGELTLSSEKGVGSRFFFSITVQESETGNTARQGHDILKGRRLLVVDDNDTNLKIIRHELNKAQITPILCSSAKEALSRLDSGAQVDMALLDYNMPEMSGGMLAARLRTQENFAARPIMILSSSGCPRDEDAEVVDRWMTKPVKGQMLRDAIFELFATNRESLRQQPSEPDPSNEEMPPPSIRILVVEDNKVNQMVTLRILSKLGYQADLASNGQEAVEAALNISYDLILMDIQMPDMDGLEATREIRGRLPDSTKPRIIGLSAHALSDSRSKALAAGMDDYLNKPVKIVELRQMLINHPD